MSCLSLLAEVSLACEAPDAFPVSLLSLFFGGSQATTGNASGASQAKVSHDEAKMRGRRVFLLPLLFASSGETSTSKELMTTTDMLALAPLYM